MYTKYIGNDKEQAAKEECLRKKQEEAQLPTEYHASQEKILPEASEKIKPSEPPEQSVL